MFNLNVTRRDPRVLRVARSLVRAGHRVVVFEMQAAGDAAGDVIDDVEIRRVPVPSRYEAEDMAEFRSVCRPAFDLIGCCDARVAGLGADDSAGHTASPMRLWNAIIRHSPRRAAAAMSESDRREVYDIRSIMLINLALYKAAESYRPTLAHCNDLDTLLIGYMFKCNHRLPVVFDAHEIYPEQLSPEMRSDIWHQFYTALEAGLIGVSDGRMTVCDSLGAYFADRYGAKGFVTVLNVPSIAFLPPKDVLSRRRGRRRLLYHGAYSAYRGLEEVIRAAPRIDDADIVFRGVGTYESTLRALCHAEGVEDRITFAAPVPVAEMIPAASDCDVGLNPFIPVCKNTEFALPNKFFEYMMAGLGSASSDLIEMRRLSHDLNVGIVFPSLEPAGIADSLNALLSQPGRIDEYRYNAYEAARTRFNWEMEEVKFLDFYSQFCPAAA